MCFQHFHCSSSFSATGLTLSRPLRGSRSLSGRPGAARSLLILGVVLLGVPGAQTLYQSNMDFGQFFHVTHGPDFVLDRQSLAAPQFRYGPRSGFKGSKVFSVSVCDSKIKYIFFEVLTWTLHSSWLALRCPRTSKTKAGFCIAKFRMKTLNHFVKTKPQV